MRIIAGRWRGIRLASVGKGDSAAHLRPTPDRVRESLFSMLTHRGVLEGAHVLDLFAGTGAFGLEALSRGAAQVMFVDNGRTAQRLINENIAKLHAEDRATLMRGDATRLGAWPGVRFDLVFLDPPYGKDLGHKALEAVAGWLSTDAKVVWEDNVFAADTVDGFHVVEKRRFGGCHISLLERVSTDTPG